MILQNSIPILEYDNNSIEIIKPDYKRTTILPEKCVFAFLGNIVDEFAKKYGAVVLDEIQTVSQNFPIYAVEYRNQSICLVQVPMGASAATSILDTLIALGCKKIIATGSCGVLVDMPENAFIIPTKALRAEGTSYHYLEPSRFIELDKDFITHIETSFTKMNIPYTECTTWTTDGFFRETEDMVKYRITEDDCSVVEMECSALAACAKKRGAQFGQFLFTADSLANAKKYDSRDFGIDSHEKALEIALEIIENF